ncbi:MAG: hypothetical protein ACNA8H_06320 [Anaerolineales bacterium]
MYTQIVVNGKYFKMPFKQLPVTPLTVHTYNMEDGETSCAVRLACPQNVHLLLINAKETCFSGKMDSLRLTFSGCLVANMAKSVESNLCDWGKIQDRANKLL